MSELTGQINSEREEVYGEYEENDGETLPCAVSVRLLGETVLEAFEERAVKATIRRS